MFNFGLPVAVTRFFKRIFSLFLKKIYSRVVLQDKTIEIRSGIIFRRRFRFTEPQIKCISLEQTVFMQLTRMYALYAVIHGESSSKDKRIAVLPICSRSEAEIQMSNCFKGVLSKTDTLYFKGRNWLRKKEVYTTAEDIGEIKLSENKFKKGCKLKLKLRSQARCAVKIKFPETENAKKYINANFCELPEHNNTK